MMQLENVTKTYNGQSVPVHAVREVDLQVAEGEFVAVMGPSGSGKSTILTVLGAMTPGREATADTWEAPRASLPRYPCVESPPALRSR